MRPSSEQARGVFANQKFQSSDKPKQANPGCVDEASGNAQRRLWHRPCEEPARSEDRSPHRPTDLPECVKLEPPEGRPSDLLETGRQACMVLKTVFSGAASCTNTTSSLFLVPSTCRHPMLVETCGAAQVDFDPFNAKFAEVEHLGRFLVEGPRPGRGLVERALGC